LSVFTCVPANPCTLINRHIFWFITIPALAWIAFVVIFFSALSIILHDRKHSHKLS
jgi:hypothetical protein